MKKLKRQLIPLIFGALFATTELMAHEKIQEPEYKVVEKTDVYEIREYTPIVAIETEVEANFEEAGNRAFRRLFKYIDGNNQSQANIAMTAPVTQNERDGKYVVRFMLPAKYTLATAPKPNDPERSGHGITRAALRGAYLFRDLGQKRLRRRPGETQAGSQSRRSRFRRRSHLVAL